MESRDPIVTTKLVLKEQNVATITSNSFLRLIPLGVAWTIFGYILLILPFNQGMFYGGNANFEGVLFQFLLLGGILFACLTAVSWMNRNNQKQLDPLTLIVWLLPVGYYIGFLSGPSSYSGRTYFYFYICLAAVFLIARNLSNKIRWMIGLFLLSGSFILFFGYANMFGNLHYVDAFFGDLRFASVFQYPNAYGALALIMIALCLYLSVNYRNKWLLMCVTFLLVPTIISFVMSLSRGAFIVAFPVLLVTLLLLPFRKQLVLCCLGVSALIITIPLSKLMYTIGVPLQKSMNAVSSFQGWAILLGSAIFYAALSTVIIRSISGWLYDTGKQRSGERWIIPSFFVLTVTVVVLIIILKPHWISFLPDLLEKRLLRINGKENSMLERFAFYRDSIKMWQHQPIFGYGGGTWKTLVYTYQSNPYASILAHSFIFQTLVETGLFGLLSVVLLLIWILIRVLRNRGHMNPEYGIMLIILAALIMTSAIDFNMNFGYLICMLFIVMGMVSTIGGQGSGVIKPLPMRVTFNFAKPIVYLVFASFLLYQSVNLLRSHAAFNAAQDAILHKEPESVIFSRINNAIENARDHPEYSTFKVMALLMVHDKQPADTYLVEAEKTLGQIKRFEKQNVTLIEAELALYMKQNRMDEAQALVINNLDIYPWDTILYDQAIMVNFTKGFMAKQDHNVAQARQYFQAAVEITNRFEKQKNKLSQLPIGQAKGLPFKLSDKSTLALGQIYAMLHNWAKAEMILKPLVSQLPDTREEINVNRWYEAVLFSQGDSPDAVKQLREADPGGESMMKELLAFIQEGNF